MRKLNLVTSFALVGFLAACAGGHYDRDGNYVTPDGRVFEPSAKTTAIVPQTQLSRTVTQSYTPGLDTDTATTRTTTVTTYGYVRAGYYDANGYYIAPGYGPEIPPRMMPAQGLCRIWYPDRLPDDQPGIQSCDDVRAQVPVGAYVVFGG